LASKRDWPGYVGTPAIANAAAGKRAMNAIAQAAIDAAVKVLDGEPDGAWPRVWDALAGRPDVRQVIDASLEHERQVERRQSAWLAQRP
jgi:hypothetical protein